MAQIANSISAFLVAHEILLFVLLAGLIFIAILLIAWVLSRAAKKAEEAAEIAKGEAPMPPPDEADKEARAHGNGLFSGREKSFASWRQVRRAFRLGLQEYRRFVAHSRNYYMVPWLLVLGEVGTGKSRILESVGPNRPPVYLPDPETGRPIGCTWWFYDEATVIEAAGEALQDGTENKIAWRGWNTLLGMLRRSRPRRPIDGIVLALPVSDLVGPDRLDLHQLRQKARDLYAKLFHAQGMLGLCMPIYIVLTKCDRLSGFAAFTRALPETLRDGIFGWSNPYPLEMPFIAPWLDDAFRMIGGDLLKLHIELHAGGRGLDNGDDIFSFASELRTLQEPLGELLTTVFRRTAYHETFYFRGIYLTGDMDGAVRPAERAVTPIRDEPVLSAHAAAHLVFTRDLFLRKIFAERDLAKFTPAAALGFRRRRLIYRGAMAAVAAVLLLMLWSDYQRASVWAITMQPALEDLPDGFRVATDGVSGLQSGTGTPTRAVQQNVANYLDDVAGLSDPFGSFLMPGSWIDGVPDKARAALAAGYYRIVLVPLRASIDRRMQALVEGRAAEGAPGGTEVDAFIQYVQAIRAIEAAADLYNRLNGSHALFGLPSLLRYIYGINLTPDFVGKAVAYDIATPPAPDRGPDIVRASELAPINLSTYRGPATDRLQELADAAYARLADGSLVSARLRLVADDLTTAMTPGTAAGAVAVALQGALAGLHDVSAQIASDSDFWTGEQSLIFSPQVAAAFDQVGQSALFGPDVRSRLIAEAGTRFAAIQPDDRMVNSVIGPLVIRDARGRASLSPVAVALMGGLDGLFHQDFMQPVPHPAVLGSGAAPVIWDNAVLAPASAMIEHYLLFAGKGLPGIPAVLQPLVRAVSLAELKDNLQSVVAGARRPIDGLETLGASGNDGLRQQIAALGAATPLLVDILQTYRQFGLTGAYDQLRALVTLQARSLLGMVDGISRDNQFFVPLPMVLESWQGGPLTNFQLFGLTDAGALDQYLDTSRQYLAAVARELAAPLITIVTRLGVDPGASPLVERWAETLADLDKYDNHAPDSSLAALNNFITADLASIDITQCAKLSGASTALFSADIFAVKLNSLRGVLLGRCQAIVGNQAFAAYNAIAQAFDRDFKGLFPFASLGNQDVTPDAAADFYQTYDQNAGTVSAALAKAPQYFISGDRVAAFLATMARARTILLPSDPNDDVPSVTLDIHCRVNRDAEIGGNQIIEWGLTAGSAAYDSLTNPVPLVWHYGDPVSLTLRWAKDSDLVPVVLRGGGSVSDRSLSFSFNGNWSLLALLRTLGTNNSVRADRGRSVVQIDFTTRPVKGGASADGRVFMSLAMQQGEGIVSGRAAHWVTVPVFPTTAPDLTSMAVPASYYGTQPLDISTLSQSLNSLNSRVPGTAVPTPLLPNAIDQLNRQ